MKITVFEKASLVAIRAEFLKLVFSNLFNPKLTLLLALISMHMSNKDFLNSTRSSLFESFKSWQLSYLHSFCLTYSGHQQFSEFWNNLPDFTFLHQLFQNSSLKFLHTILWRATLALRNWSWFVFLLKIAQIREYSASRLLASNFEKSRKSNFFRGDKESPGKDTKFL